MMWGRGGGSAEGLRPSVTYRLRGNATGVHTDSDWAGRSAWSSCGRPGSGTAFLGLSDGILYYSLFLKGNLSLVHTLQTGKRE